MRQNHATQVAVARTVTLNLNAFLILSIVEPPLHWAGRQIRPDKRGSIPSERASILDRQESNKETWFELLKNFRKRFRSEGGLKFSLRASISIAVSDADGPPANKLRRLKIFCELGFEFENFVRACIL